MGSNLIIRDAVIQDCSEICRLIHEMALFEKMPDSPRVDVKSLERDGFELEEPLYQSIVAEEQNPTQGNSKLVGYVIFHYAYSTWNGKKIYLEDIFVTESYRGKGIGKALFEKVCQRAVNENCEVMTLTVLKWNPATKFYKSFGAEDITETEKWHFYSLKKKDFSEVAKVTDL